MTEEERLQKRVSDLEDKVERLRAIVLALLDNERKAAVTEARRMKNLIHQDEQYVLMCEELAASVT